MDNLNYFFIYRLEKMQATEAILIVIVLVLIFIIIYNNSKGENNGEATYDCIERGGNGNIRQMTLPSGHNKGCQCQKCSDVEARTLGENVEFFTTCADYKDEVQHLNNSCTKNDLLYAENPYGAKGIDYHEFIASQAISPEVVANHAQFVKSRWSKGEGWTGSTFSPDKKISGDVYPWVGLRRPEKVPICNPTQIPTFTYSDFEPHSSIAWGSGRRQIKNDDL
ncbi:MAG: hypothetical protein ACYCPT_09010 [Acidimicrobiales bacterium]